MMPITNETWVQCEFTLTHICESCQLQSIVNVQFIYIRVLRLVFKNTMLTKLSQMKQ